MFAAQDPGSLMLIILAIVAMAVAFWRTTIKLLIIGVIVLVSLGLLSSCGAYFNRSSISSSRSVRAHGSQSAEPRKCP